MKGMRQDTLATPTTVAMNYLSSSFITSSKKPYCRRISMDIFDCNAFGYLEKGLKRAVAADYEAALCALDLALQLDTSLIDVYYNRGLIYLKTGRYLDAIENFDYALFPPNTSGSVSLPEDLKVMAYCYRGQAHHFLGYLKQALEDCNYALGIDFYCAQVYKRRGLVKLDLGWRQEALEDLQTAAYIDEVQGNFSDCQSTEKLISSLFSS